MSRPPKSLRQHQLHGTFRADRHRGFPAAPPTKPPRPPSWLSKEAKSKWKQTAKLLATAGVLTALDLDALAAYCEAFATWRDATETVEKEGIIFKTEAGLVKRHPAVAIADQANRRMLAWAEKLGLTPAARQRLAIELPVEEEPDPFDKFLLDGRSPDGPPRDKSRYFRQAPNPVASRVRG